MVLPLLKSDLLEIMQAVTEERLDEVPVEFADGAACCVIMASEGYPVAYAKGYPITVPEDLADRVYVAGAAEKDGQLVTSGGRVLGVTETAETLPEAIEKAYTDVARIHFDNEYYRKDIGQRGLKALAE